MTAADFLAGPRHDAATWRNAFDPHLSSYAYVWQQDRGWALRGARQLGDSPSQLLTNAPELDDRRVCVGDLSVGVVICGEVFVLVEGGHRDLLTNRIVAGRELDFVVVPAHSDVPLAGQNWACALKGIAQEARCPVLLAHHLERAHATRWREARKSDAAPARTVWCGDPIARHRVDDRASIDVFSGGGGRAVDSEQQGVVDTRDGTGKFPLSLRPDARMAGRVSEQVREEIERRSSLASVIGEYVTLQQQGRVYRGLCPFHGEKSPSLVVHEADGHYYCFGCHAKGDAIRFLTEHVGYSFIEAFTQLAERCGVDLELEEEEPHIRARRRKRREARERYAEINGAALEHFRSRVNDPEARAYLTKRGLGEDVVQQFQVGFAPEGWDLLARAMVRKGSSAVRAALAVGLLGQRKSPDARDQTEQYDKFRHRVIFPVFGALRGEVIGFAGRTLSTDKEEAKYLNSSESELFGKGRCLYGLFHAKKQIRDTGFAVLVEGQIDVLTLAQAGFGAVAPMGTSLTEVQCLLLKQCTNTVHLAYDGDSAGRAAAIKAIVLLLGAGLTGRMALLPEGEDPDTLVRTQGCAALEALIEAGMTLLDNFVEDAMTKYDGSYPSMARVMLQVAPIYGLVESLQDRMLCRGKLQRRLNLTQTDMDAWLGRP